MVGLWILREGLQNTSLEICSFGCTSRGGPALPQDLSKSKKSEKVLMPSSLDFVVQKKHSWLGTDWCVGDIVRIGWQGITECLWVLYFHLYLYSSNLWAIN